LSDPVPRVRSCLTASFESSIFDFSALDYTQSSNALITKKERKTELAKSAFETNLNFREIARKVVRFKGLKTPSSTA